VIKVFVYGTLKPGEANYQKYCAGKVVEATEAYTWGQLYNLSVGYPAMTEGNSKVKGVLLTFDNAAILKNLDELEDYDEMRSPELNEYYRKQIAIYCFSGEFLGQAWGYLMTLAKVKQLGGVIFPSESWTGFYN
jgi:gamma-glutamylcyclotransferase (GGCT)/AIG2-like uncharacterized protein YtfP